MSDLKSRRRRGRKTWSEFGALGRKPSRYEILTHGMNHTLDGLELGPDVHGNVWLREHRDQVMLQVPDWDSFRDPDEMTYDRYVTTQDAAEIYVDGVIARFEPDDAELGPAAVEHLARTMAPSRYLSHAQQMLSAYVQQLAPGNYVANCASFQTADQLRRTQRIAERTKMLALAHPEAGFGEREREVWERDEHWQPIRKLCEQALVRYDWDAALVATNLVVKPLCDALLLSEFAHEARAAGAEADALIAENLSMDSSRSQRWTAALVRFAVEERAENADVVNDLVDGWSPLADEVLDAGSELIAVEGGRGAAEIRSSAAEAWDGFLAECGLGR